MLLVYQSTFPGTASSDSHLSSHLYNEETAAGSSLKNFKNSIRDPKTKKHTDNDSENLIDTHDNSTAQCSSQNRQWLERDILRPIFHLLKIQDLRTAAQFVLFYISPKHDTVNRSMQQSDQQKRRINKVVIRSVESCRENNNIMFSLLAFPHFPESA